MTTSISINGPKLSLVAITQTVFADYSIHCYYSNDVCDAADVLCSTNNSGCSDQASCSFTDGNVTCTCNTGYDGDGFTCSGKST